MVRGPWGGSNWSDHFLCFAHRGRGTGRTLTRGESQRMRTVRWIVVALLLTPGAWGQDGAKGLPDSATDPVRAFLTKSCLECHGPEKTKGKFRVDQLDFTLAAKA